MHLPHRLFLLLTGLIWGIAACTAPAEPATRIVEVTRVVSVTPIVEASPAVPSTPVPGLLITPTPAPLPGQTFISSSPDTLVYLAAAEPLTLDPVLAADPAGMTLLQNVSEPLLMANPNDPAEFLPLLATSWDIAEDGLTYVLRLRPGVTFSDGTPLAASDVAYSLQRALLQSDPAGWQGQLIPPLLGYSGSDVTAEIDDGAYIGDREALIANANARDLVAVCEQVKAAIMADDPAGTVTLNLTQSWGPLLATLSQPWTGILSRSWAIAQGDWDDNCDTWQAWYAPGPAGSPLAGQLLGTGPYVLDHWTPGTEYTLVANQNYWRPANEPLGSAPDGPAGAPAIATVQVRVLPDAADRLALLRQGLADLAEIPAGLRTLADAWVGEQCDWSAQTCTATDDPAGSLRKIGPLPATTRTDLLFNYSISAENNPYIGSGLLDGSGIPPDFFSDLNVRRAFSYCLDSAQVISRAYFGLGIPNNSVIPPFMLGYNPEQDARDVDPDRCRDELVLAWGTQLAPVGFRVQLPYVSGDAVQVAALESLQANLTALNPAFRVELVGLPRPVYQEQLRAGQLPLIFLTWNETLHDPHNWAAPYFSGEYADYQRLPDELREQLGALVSAGLTATVPAGRDRIYQDLGRVRYTTTANIILPQPAGVQYQQRWLRTTFLNPILPGPYFYGYTLHQAP